jgi:hypothetical protein
VGLALVVASCVVVVLAIVSLLVVQLGNTPASKPSSSLCFDRAMQKEMPCSQTP